MNEDIEEDVNLVYSQLYVTPEASETEQLNTEDSRKRDGYQFPLSTLVSCLRRVLSRRRRIRSMHLQQQRRG